MLLCKSYNCKRMINLCIFASSLGHINFGQNSISLAIIKLHKISSEWTPHLIVVEPSDDLVALVSDLLAILLAKFLLQLVVLRRRLHVVGVALERVLRLNTIALLFVVVLVLLGVVHHAFDVGLAQATCNQRTLQSSIHRLVTSTKYLRRAGLHIDDNFLECR